MASIFMWKASSSLPSSSPSVVYYHGVDWFMEEREDSTVAYQYLYQSSLEEVTVYQAVRMPMVCPGLLEVVRLPYQLLRKGRRGEFCQVGDWMRVLLYSKGESYDWKQAQEWMNSSVEEEIEEAERLEARELEPQRLEQARQEKAMELESVRQERGWEKAGRGRGGGRGRREAYRGGRGGRQEAGRHGDRHGDRQGDRQGERGGRGGRGGRGRGGLSLGR